MLLVFVTILDHGISYVRAVLIKHGPKLTTLKTFAKSSYMEQKLIIAVGVVIFTSAVAS
jgi:hypothetical protein